MTFHASKGSKYDPCVTCPCHNGEWRMCQAVDNLSCPEHIETDDVMDIWRIPDECPLPVQIDRKE